MNLPRIKPIAKTRSRSRKDMTDAERVFWRHVRQRQVDGSKFRRQHPIGDYIADFVCIEAKLIVEIDGGQHSVSVLQDEARTAELERHGFRVLMFWNNDVLNNMDGVMGVLIEALQASIDPHPGLPPGRGKEQT